MERDIMPNQQRRTEMVMEHLRSAIADMIPKVRRTMSVPWARWGRSLRAWILSVHGQSARRWWQETEEVRRRRAAGAREGRDWRWREAEITLAVVTAS
jgi:hypothetical protein